MYNFFLVLWHYVVEIIPSLALGFLLSGVIHEFVPQSWVDRYLTKKGILPLLYVTIAGIILPLCCFGTLPIAISFRKKGIPLGPILAFLVATPATSITSILVTYRLLGIGFTVYLCLCVILMGLTIGLIGNLLPLRDEESKPDGCSMCEQKGHTDHRHHQKGIKNRVVSVLSFGFVDIPKHIGPELAIGLILASLVASIIHLGEIIRAYLSAGLGYIFALVFGLSMYICSTASVPLVHAFIGQGLDVGAGLVLLLVGPITSYGTILVIRKEFGTKILLIYLGVISSLSLVLGYIFSYIS